MPTAAPTVGSKPVPATKATVASAAYDRLRRDILHGVLRPGERLRLAQLAEAYGCGMGALREALSRLVGDNIVEFEDRRGFAVPEIDPGMLTELLEMRMMLEEKALRESIARGGVDWEVAVMGAYHRLSRSSEQRADPRRHDDVWERDHHAFHRALVSGYEFPLLHQFRELVLAHSDRYRHIYWQYAAQGRDALSEHKAIMEAALRRDADATVALMRKHLRRTLDALLAAGFGSTPAPKVRRPARVR